MIFYIFKEFFEIKNDSLILKCYYVDEGYEKIVADALH